MSQQILSSVQNTFTRGLITEATGLNFPENACTSTQNCVFSLVGDVTRREGFDFESSFSYNNVTAAGAAYSTYKWNNAGGDGNTQLVVTQIGTALYFYKSSSANPSISGQLLSSSVNLSAFFTPTGSFDPTIECQFTDGNGYLFVFHPSIDPVYCVYNNNVITANVINIQIRDFVGLIDNLPVSARPTSLSNEHNYNIQNQGWTAGNAWYATSTDFKLPVGGPVTWNVSGTTGMVLGQVVSISGTNSFGKFFSNEAGTITGISGSAVTINVYSVASNAPAGSGFNTWTFTPISTGYVNTWFSSQGNYPSNADVWWYFKDTSNAFNPSSTQPNVTLSTGNAPRGHIILSAFNQDRTAATGVNNLTKVSTTARPTTGTWFQGRVWYTGVNASQVAQGNANYYSWSENVYFSKIVTSPSDFGSCFQQNDPTSQNLFSLLPTDGGVISIPGSGAIYKLFPIANGMIVFAANGIWFITGSQGIGFTASDYTITKLSQIQSISPYSFVNVLGLPYFWNIEGIYKVSPSQNGQLTVEPITVGTILTYYNNIPISSKKYARGDYDPVNYTIQWLFKSTTETNIGDRYYFDSILNFNTYNKAFFPYQFTGTTPKILGINYVNYPTGTLQPDFKYFTLGTTNNYTFSEERDGTNWLDFVSFDGVGVDYTSNFVTGYTLRGQGMKKFQPEYIQLFSRTNGVEGAYTFQSQWDYANQLNSNRWSTVQYFYNTDTRFDFIPRRHRLRGHGYTLQFKVSSVKGLPFDIIGWSVLDTVNAGA